MPGDSGGWGQATEGDRATTETVRGATALAAGPRSPPSTAMTVGVADNGSVTLTDAAGNDPAVVTTDVQARNGVIHVIYAVLPAGLSERIASQPGASPPDAPRPGPRHSAAVTDRSPTCLLHIATANAHAAPDVWARRAHWSEVFTAPGAALRRDGGLAHDRVALALPGVARFVSVTPAGVMRRSL